jgi:3',5'-nucleoside bisphosphate phosphatase
VTLAAYDLHSHSTASDGILSPEDLVKRAHANGVRVLSLTDHDGIGGLAEASAAAKIFGVEFVPGVEISVTWRDSTVHIVGVGIDPNSKDLTDGLDSVSGSRLRRGIAIAEELRRVGIDGTLDAAITLAKDSRSLSRAHFARVLVEKGYAADTKSVFHRFLAKGKPGYVPHQWATLENAVRWISAAGGVAVIAHPGRYAFSDEEAHAFLSQFRELGGKGVEVLTGSHTPQQARKYAELSKKYRLKASCGSDFHGPNESRIDLGRLPELPGELEPVWDCL